MLIAKFWNTGNGSNFPCRNQSRLAFEREQRA